MKEWETGMAERRGRRTRESFRRKYGRSLGASRKPIHPYGRPPSGRRRRARKRESLHRVSRGMQEEWAAGVSQWVARREVERVNLYFRRKVGLIQGHSTDEWKEGYGEWQDRALMSQAWKWLRRPRKPMPRSRAKRRMVACVRESVDRSASSRRRRISSPRQAAPKTEAREAKPERQPEVSADHLVTEDSDEGGILSTETVAAIYEGIYVFSQKAEKRHGPYTMMQLQKLVDQGYFTAHDLAIYQGLEQWVTLKHVPDIRFPVVEAPAESEPEPAPEEDAPILTTELVEDAESDQRQAEVPGKRNLAGFLFRMAAVVCAFLILFLYLCDIVNQRMGWKIPIGLGLAGIETVPARVNVPNPEVAEIGDTYGGKGADEETEAHETVQPPPQPAQPVFLTQGLVAYYPFDGNALDMSGNGRNGTVTDAKSTTDRLGLKAKALSFDGQESHVRIALIPDMNEVSISVWAKFSTMLKRGTIFCDSTPTFGNDFFFQVSPERLIVRADKSGSSLWERFDVDLTQQKEQWMHLCSVVSIKQCKVYANGSRVGFSEKTGNNIGFHNPSGAVIGIGDWWGKVRDEPFEGSLDDFRIYHRPLSDVEVATLYNHEKSVGAKAVVVSDTHSIPAVDGKPFTIPDLDLEMLWCPPGTFEMGSPTTEAGRKKDETQHQVTLTKGFYLGKYEVTQAQWGKVMGTNPSFFKGTNRPVEKVTWTEVNAFCEKLTETERTAGRLPAGMAYQLPTEAQWEYACRAGTKTAFFFGDSLTSGQANISSGARGTTHVGKYPANAWGFHDMHGNVFEWCADWVGDYPSGAGTDPVGPAVGSGRVTRGGSWYFKDSRARSALRIGLGPAFSDGGLGFRLCFGSASK